MLVIILIIIKATEPQPFLQNQFYGRSAKTHTFIHFVNSLHVCCCSHKFSIWNKYTSFHMILLFLIETEESSKASTSLKSKAWVSPRLEYIPDREMKRPMSTCLRFQNLATTDINKLLFLRTLSSQQFASSHHHGSNQRVQAVSFNWCVLACR